MSVYQPFKTLQNLSRIAAIWLGGPSTLSFEKSNDLFKIWNGAYLRYCTDGAANILLDYCRSGDASLPHSIVGDLDSISEETKSFFASKDEVKIIKIDDQSDTDLAKAFNLLNEKLGTMPSYEVISSIVLIGGFSMGRFDHIFGALNAVLTYITNPSSIVRSVFAIDNENILTILPMGAVRISLDQTKITKTCGIMPICQRPTKVHTKGFYWNLDESHSFEFGSQISSSNRIVNDEQVITTSEPVVFVFELKKPNVLF